MALALVKNLSFVSGSVTYCDNSTRPLVKIAAAEVSRG
jgi:hypothetical protein